MSGAATSGALPELGAALERGYVLAFRMLGSRDEARDACQEAAARALTAASTYDRSKPFYPWFHRILRNLCVDRIARRRRERPDGAVGEEEATPDAPRSAEGALIEGERARAVAAAIAKLPDELREVIELRHFEDMSYEEMAETLGWPLGTVMSRLYRARAQLRAALARDPAFAGEPRDGRAR